MIKTNAFIVHILKTFIKNILKLLLL